MVPNEQHLTLRGIPGVVIVQNRHSGMVREHRTRNLEISMPRRPE